MKVESAWGSSKPVSVMIYPILFENEVLGVVELATFDETTSLQERLLSQLSQSLGIILNNITGRLRVGTRESQAMTEELQVQSEERRPSKKSFAAPTKIWRSKPMPSSVPRTCCGQQEELEHYNTELVAKTRALEEQVQEVEEKNDEIEKARMRSKRSDFPLQRSISRSSWLICLTSRGPA